MHARACVNVRACVSVYVCLYVRVRAYISPSTSSHDTKFPSQVLRLSKTPFPNASPARYLPGRKPLQVDRPSVSLIGFAIGIIAVILLEKIHFISVIIAAASPGITLHCTLPRRSRLHCSVYCFRTTREDCIGLLRIFKRRCECGCVSAYTWVPNNTYNLCIIVCVCGCVCGCPCVSICVCVRVCVVACV